MRRRKDLLKRELSEVVFIDDKLVISRDNNYWMFEVGNEITTDMGEAVAMMMRNFDSNHIIWETEIDMVNMDDISPDKSLFWLTGGYQEWRGLEHYKLPWYDCYLDFQEEFGFLIINIINRSKSLGDIREGFIKYLNLPMLYDFAISKGIVR